MVGACSKRGGGGGEARTEIRTVAFIWAGTLVDETYTAVAFLQTDIRQDGIASRNTAGFNATLRYMMPEREDTMKQLR